MDKQLEEEEDKARLDQMIASMSNDFSHLKALIKTLEHTIQCTDKNVQVRAHYLPFRNGKPCTGELLDNIRGYICNFAMSRSEIDLVHKSAATFSPQQMLIAYNKLRDDAADLFIKAQKSTSRNGECGELILYLLIEWILEAPQILAKMSLKTSGQMPVHGSDGIHVKYDPATDGLIFFWGEAKFHATISGAMSSAVTSISSTLKYDKLKEDINLVRRYISFSGLSPGDQTKVVEFLDPLSQQYQKKTDASACLIGFDFDGFAKLKDCDSATLELRFRELLEEALKSAAASLASNLEAAGISHHRMEVFFIPVPSVEDLRIEFQNRIGWKS
ncbi:DUF1837 domain-containing protein [Mesorhizobium sp. M0977]|uniref:HamA C-terminal domain-containing protein n=1 Tax=Mesorhizobium sp. M0977 TaxID=2957039 RepID=UPI003336DE2D